MKMFKEISNQDYWKISPISKVQASTDIYLKNYESFLLNKTKEYIPEDQIETVVVFGIGAGRELLGLCEHFPKATIIGYDISDELLKKCNERITEYNLSDRVKVFEADICGVLEAKDVHADIVFMSNCVLNYITPLKSREQVMRNAYSLLKEGGLVTGEVHNRFDSILKMGYFLLQYIVIGFTPKLQIGDRYVKSGEFKTRNHYFHKVEIKSLLSKFKNIDIINVNELGIKYTYNTFIFMGQKI